MRHLCALVAAVVVSSCASGGMRPATTMGSSVTTAADPAQADGSAETAIAPAAATPSSGSDFNPPAGYQKRSFEGRTVYCRSETPVGTRFPKRYCLTQDQLERIEANRRNVQREVDRARRNCVAGGSYCGGG